MPYKTPSNPFRPGSQLQHTPIQFQIIALWAELLILESQPKEIRDLLWLTIEYDRELIEEYNRRLHGD
jgi:hypothetical protein